MRSRVVRVDQVGIPRSQHGADATSGREVPVAAHAYGGCGDPGGPQAPDQRRVRRGDHQWLVPVLTKAACEQIHLALPAAPFAARVQVKYAQRWRVGHAWKNVAEGGRPQRGGTVEARQSFGMANEANLTWQRPCEHDASTLIG